MNHIVEPADVRRFRNVLAQRLGLCFDEARTDFLADVLRQRLAVYEGPSASYVSRLAAYPQTDELAMLAVELTVGETYFFRHVEQFDALADIALPERMRARARVGGRSLRMLSVGCSSGEEAYTLAMVALECVPDPPWNVSILGIDINPVMLGKARRARYSPWSMRAVPEQARRRWFSVDGGEGALDGEVRGRVRFAARNIADNDSDLWQPDAYDVVFCRNVLMYFAPEQGQALVKRMTRALAPGGYLFLGHAESLRGVTDELDLCQSHDTFYYRRGLQPAATIVGPPRQAMAYSAIQGSPRIVGGLGGADSNWPDAVGKAAERVRALAEAGTSPARSSGPVQAFRDPPGWDRAMTLLREERYGQGLLVADAFPPEAQAHPDTLVLRAVLLLHSGQIDHAELICRQLLTIDGLHVGAHYLLAACREGGGDWREAIAFNRVAAYLDPGFAMPRLRLGLLAHLRGDPDGACAELACALTLLAGEDAQRLVLFGGGFGRQALIALCRSELVACGGIP
jgi:chemotaxis protein methyltransferase CheR